MTSDVLQTFKVEGSKVKVTAWHSVSAISALLVRVQTRARWKLSPSRAQHMWHMFKVVRSNSLEVEI